MKTRIQMIDTWKRKVYPEIEEMGLSTIYIACFKLAPESVINESAKVHVIIPTALLFVRTCVCVMMDFLWPCDETINFFFPSYYSEGLCVYTSNTRIRLLIHFFDRKILTRAQWKFCADDGRWNFRTFVSRYIARIRKEKKKWS